jgi:methyl-accepting chemotaxis protein
MKKPFSLKRSIIYLFVLLAILAFVNIATTTWLTYKLTQHQEQAKVINSAAYKSNELKYQIAQIQQYLTDVSATGERDGFKDAEAHYLSTKALLNELVVLKPESKLLIDDTHSRLESFYEIGKKMAEIYIAKGRDAGNVLMKQPVTGFDDQALSLIESLDKQIIPLQKQDIAIKNTVHDEVMSLRFSSILRTILSASLFFIALIFLSRRIIKHLGGEPVTMLGLANEIAQGNLTNHINVKAGDSTSLAAALNTMQINLSTLIFQIQASADSISTGAQQISAGNMNLSQRTEEQASSLEETASSMEQMASTVKQNAENAKQANIFANDASGVATKGGQVVNQVVHTMADINTSSKKIVEIISVIDGIAFQTNILALNAAVEAARAGEQGRGFAVVAAEVRSLAQRSASAAKEIKQLIGDSVEKVSVGTKQVEAAGITMGEIVNAVKQVTDIVNEITVASMEQSAGIDQVNNAITSMDEVTQQNAALVEEAAAAANSLEDKAHELTDATNKFNLDHSQHMLGEQTSNQQTGNRIDLNELKASHSSRLPRSKTNRHIRIQALKTKVNESAEWTTF